MTTRLEYLQRTRKTLVTISDWSKETRDRLTAQLEREEVVDVESLRQPDYPPCPVCAATVTDAKHIKRDLGLTFKPCGCELSTESPQTRFACSCFTVALLAMALAGVGGFVAGPTGIAGVLFTVAAFLVVVGVVVFLLPRRRVF